MMNESVAYSAVSAYTGEREPRYSAFESLWLFGGCMFVHFQARAYGSGTAETGPSDGFGSGRASEGVGIYVYR
jgi:hypothetical protein